MQDLIISNNIHTIDAISGYTITGARFVVKCSAGFMTVSDARDFEIQGYNNHPEWLINGYKKGALQTVQVQLEGSNYYVTVFARQGKKIHMIDKAILADLTVGTINSMFQNTELYSHYQYQAVGATSWASKAYVMNQSQEVA